MNGTKTLSFAENASLDPGRMYRQNLSNSFSSYNSSMGTKDFQPYIPKSNIKVPQNWNTPTQYNISNNSHASEGHINTLGYHINLSKQRTFSFLSEITADITKISLNDEDIEDKLSVNGSQTEDDVSVIKKTYWKSILSLSIAFFLFFSSFIGLTIIQSSINGNVGILGLVVIFLMTIISVMIISPLTIRFLGFKHTMLVSFVAFLSWEVSNFYPHLGTVLPTAVLSGIGNGVIWSSQATYFSQQNIIYAKVTQEPVELVMSRSFGIFFCFLLSGSSFGCLLTSLILTLNTATASNTTRTHDSLLPNCGANFCPMSTSQQHSDPYNALTQSSSPVEQYRIFIMVGIHSLLSIVAIVILVLFVDNVNEFHQSDKSLCKQVCHSILASLKQLKLQRQLLMTPLNIYTGLSKSFMLGEITQAFIGCAFGVEMIGYGSVMYGLTSCAAAIASGYIIRKTGRITLFVASAILTVGNCLFLLLWTPDIGKVAVFYIIPGLWALPDGIFISQMNSFYGFIFHDNAQGAFASFRFWEGIGLVLGFIMNAFICVKYKIYAMLSLLALGLAGYLLTERVQRVKDRNKDNLEGTKEQMTLSITHGAHNSFNSSFHSLQSHRVHRVKDNKKVFTLTNETIHEKDEPNQLRNPKMFETSV